MRFRCLYILDIFWNGTVRHGVIDLEYRKSFEDWPNSVSEADMTRGSYTNPFASGRL